MPPRVSLTLCLVFLTTGALAEDGPVQLANYALNQPIEDARNVVPVGRTRQTWVLRCTGDSVVPSGLTLSTKEQEAGVVRCWPMKTGLIEEVRTAHPIRRARYGEEEIEFLHGRIVRIRINRFYDRRDADHYVVRNSGADLIDALQR